MAAPTDVDDHRFSDPEGFEDDVEDDDVIRDLLYEEPRESQYEECCIMVFNIPTISSDRLPKLRNVLAGVFSIQNTYKYNDNYPLSEDGKTKGFCFLEYQTKEAANAVLAVCDGHRLDKNHTFAAYPFTAVRSMKEPEKDWKKPERQPYVDLGDPWSWLQNPKCLDQFAILYESGQGSLRLDMFWNARTGEPIVVENACRDNWSNDLFKWSTHGTYLATMNNDKRNQRLGAVIWGGEKFDKFQRFSHEGVNYMEFSPNEKYIVTYACDQNSNRDNENCLRIFEVFTGELKKAFSPSLRSAGRLHDWPFLKWSHDEKFFAFCRLRGNCVNVFSTDDFMLCDNKAIELEGLVCCEFNPTKNLIAYYCEERSSANAPAEIGLLDVQTRTKLRASRTFSVSQSSLFWQKSGSYLAAHTERYQKMVKSKEGEIKYTGTSSHVEIFDCTDKTFAVQSIQLPEPFVNLAWEPKGNKFCVLVGTGQKVTPLIYRLDRGKPVPQLIGKIEASNGLNTAMWAPQGGWVVVMGVNTSSGVVCFIDANGITEATKAKTIEHTSLSQGSWDPTGRYFVTCTFGGKSRYETGYRIHSFQGRELRRKAVDSLLRFKWRPRPPVSLPEQKVREVRKSMKQQSTKFEEEDKKELLKVSKEIIEQRKRALEQFSSIRAAASRAHAEERSERIELRGGIDQESVEKDLVEETITVALNTEKEKIKDEGRQ
uniref:Eukaryotic translation initiation factor 3 subunit B n=1 Tax=Globodera rostochiensis TaxID=31243 RepID=A0A914HAV1_GLORO